MERMNVTVNPEADPRGKYGAAISIKKVDHILKHGTRVKIEFPPNKYGPKICFGQVGTIAGYALANNNCPVHALARSIKNGHSMHPWINQDCTVITSDVAYNTKRLAEQEAGKLLKAGDMVYIEGRTGVVMCVGSAYSNMATIVLDTLPMEKTV